MERHHPQQEWRERPPMGRSSGIAIPPPSSRRGPRNRSESPLGRSPPLGAHFGVSPSHLQSWFLSSRGDHGSSVATPIMQGNTSSPPKQIFSLSRSFLGRRGSGPLTSTRRVLTRRSSVNAFARGLNVNMSDVVFRWGSRAKGGEGPPQLGHRGSFSRGEGEGGGGGGGGGGGDHPLHPLSYNQELLWDLMERTGSSVGTSVHFRARLTGLPDIRALRGSFQALVERHYSLRTSFVVKEGVIYQQINDPGPVDFVVEEHDTVTATEWLARETQQPFDLEKGPLFRVRLLLSTTEGEYLLLCVHRLVCDMLSLVVLLDDLRVLYQTHSLGRMVRRGSLMTPDITTPPECLSLHSPTPPHFAHTDSASCLLCESEIHPSPPLTPLGSVTPVIPLSSPAPSLSTVRSIPVCTYHGQLPPLDMHYIDYVHSLAEYLESIDGERLWKFWQQQLQGALPHLDLPTDRPRPPIQSFQGASCSFSVSRDMAIRLREMARREGATMYALMLAAFQTLLHRYTRQDDILVGSPMSCRTRSALKNLIGYFVNPVVLRADFADNPTFRNFLARIRRTVNFALEHQEFPLHLLLERLHPNRDFSESPLFQAMFVYERAHFFSRHSIAPFIFGKGNSPLTLGGLKLESIPFEEQISEHELTMFLAEQEEGIMGFFQYRTDLFNHSTIVRMAGHFVCLLESILREPTRRIDQLDMVSNDDETQMLFQFHKDLSEQELELTHIAMERVVSSQPQAVAVTFGGHCVSYDALNRRANQLAHYMRLRGVGTNVLVGVCLHRSVDLVVAVLAILKAGGAYVPLDPTYPKERLAFMFRDVKLRFVVTQAAIRSEYLFHGVVTIMVDDEHAFPRGAENEDNPTPITALDSVAYVIFTSGSTGRPKGVAITHRILSNLVQWQSGVIPPEAGGRVLQFAPVSFDVSTQEILSTLSTGGTLVLVDEATRVDTRSLIGLLMDQCVTRLFLPYVALAHMAETMAAAPVPRDLRQVITAGEQLQVTSHLIRFFNALGSSCTLHNHYGPSETHVVTAHTLRGPPNTWAPLPPIGVPIDNARCYVLNSELQPMPVGLPGELYIGGFVLAQGYWNRAELTAERFLPDPFSTHPDGGRMYKTGDLCKISVKGVLDYLGRADMQLKIRGFRIEPGEVECALHQHSAVHEAVVEARGGRGVGEKCLVAYLILVGGADVNSHDLRRFLRSRLPDYMVPSAFVPLDAFPLTPSGKLDRRSLPDLSEDVLGQPGSHVAPRTETEMSVAELFESVLHVQRVGVFDNFFDLGGHSIRVVQLKTRVFEKFRVDVDVKHFFEQPTVAALSRKIEQALDGAHTVSMPLSPIESEVAEEPEVEVQLEDMTVCEKDTDGTSPSNFGTPGSRYALSFGQDALRFIHNLNPAGASDSVYNINVPCRVVGALDEGALQRALDYMVKRHPILNTTYQEDMRGAAYQEVVEACAKFVQRRVQPGENILEIMEDEGRKPFHLDTDSMLRVYHFALSDPETVNYLLFTFHHIAVDLWCLVMFFEELGMAYDAERQHIHPDLPPLEVTFAHHVAREHVSFLGGGTPAGLTSLNYWLKELQPPLPPLDLPTNRPRPPVQTFRGRCHHFHWSPGFTKCLVSFARNMKCTIFTVCLATFHVLLHRYTGNKDILVGTPMANRSIPELQAAMGYFVNPVVIRGRFDGDPPFETFVKQIRTATLGAISHQAYPFPLLVERLGASSSSDHSRSALFQALFVFHNPQRLEGLTPFFMGDEGARLRLGSLDLECVRIEQSQAQTDLTLVITGGKDGGCSCFLQYNTDLFDHGTIVHMAAHYENLLTAVFQHPTQRISILPLLTPEEKETLLVDWNNTEADFPDGTAHGVFEEQARHTPEAIAVVGQQGEEHITYGELNARANQLGRYLRRHGTQAEERVGVCMGKGVDLVVGMLGVMKSGGVYVPLDPTYPTARLEHIIRDACVQVILCQDDTIGTVPGSYKGQIIAMDKTWIRISRESRANLPERLVADTTAGSSGYMIYTSGSTGEPKGVLLHHRGLCNLAPSQIRAFRIDPTSRILQFASTSFDASLSEMIVSLHCGSTLIASARSDLMPGPPLHSTLRTLQVTAITLPPSVLAVMGPEGLEHVCTVVSAGESCAVDVVNRWSLGRTFVNAYGPTEGTVCTTCGDVDSGRVSSPPIGKPIGNMEVYVLDRELQPVPVGVPGELYISGTGLAYGYNRLPDMTGDRFVPNPFYGDPGSRMYRSGDLAKLLPDGQLEFLGRIDNQVKIRGFRIELGEIESTLSRHPDVDNMAVLLREDVTGNKQLVAYVSLKPCARINPTSRELREFLSGLLPSYMVPAVFVILDTMPLSPNGKIDRSKLPPPGRDRVMDTQYRPPRTSFEHRMADLWEELLSVKTVGVNDNFFELGGHSLIAMQLISRVRDLFGVELSLSTVFQTPILASLAERVEAAAHVCVPTDIDEALFGSELSVEEPEDHQTPLSYNQEALWIVKKLNPDSRSYHVTFVATIHSPLHLGVLQASLQSVVDRHPALRTVFVEDSNGIPLQEVCDDQKMDFERIEGYDWDDTRTMQFLREQTGKPFKLEDQSPLFRTRLVERARDLHVLVLVAHHSIMDLWAMVILLRDFDQIYRARISNQKVALPPVPTTYAQYARWQRVMVTGPEGDRLWNYWHRQLAGNLSILNIPADYPRSPVLGVSGAAYSFTLGSDITSAMRELAVCEGCTLATVLLAAYQTLLFRYTNQKDILVGSPMSCRNQMNLEKVVGHFVNIVVLRADFSRRPTFRGFLRQTKQTLIQAMVHQDYPFSRLVERFQQFRDPSRPPLCQAVFAFEKAQRPEDEAFMPFIMGDAGGHVTLGGLEFRSIELKENVSDFEVALLAAEMENRVCCTLQYNTDLFWRDSMAHMAGHLETMIRGFLKRPDQRVTLLPLLTPEEKETLLVDWNNTEADFPDGTAHGVFEEQARHTPEAIAVVGQQGEEHVTYGELNARANQLGRYLRRHGTQAEERVGVCMGKGVDLVVGMLGVMKSGGVYVPLDPTYPTARLEHIIRDACVQVILCQDDTIGTVPGSYKGQIIAMDKTWIRISRESRANLPERLVADTTAGSSGYMIYTSGSTGEPKGVLLHHRGLCNLAPSQIRAFRIDPTSRILQFASTSFDASLSEMIVSLHCGSTLIASARSDLMPGPPLHSTLRTLQVTAITLPPSVLAVMGPEGLEHVCTVVSAGESCAVDVVNRWSLGRTFVNAYGPTEGTVCTTCGDVDSGRVSSPPIGKPIGNMEVYVLDRELQPVPVGVPGELYISGTGLAYGYNRLPDMTGDRFVPNPFYGDPGSRMYRSGDLAKLLPDGQLEFLGRIDNQVKIRGFRIELGEIESTLSRHPDVLENVVIMREDTPGDRRIVVYAVLRDSSLPGVTSSQLRVFLQEKLPAYMIPSHIIILSALPLSPNGKVDRTALPNPGLHLDPSGAIPSLRPPHTQNGEAMAQIWTDILGVPVLSMDSNFFDLGGHSLAATRLVSRIRETFHVELSLGRIFDTPTTSGILDLVEAAISSKGGADYGERTIVPPVPDTLDLDTEIALDPLIVPRGTAVRSFHAQSNVFLTGATGFLGAFLLRDLLHVTSGRVFCLVRAKDAAEGAQRLADSMNQYGIWDSMTGERIVPVVGDLSQPLLGMTPPLFDEVSREVDVLFHSGSTVNFVYPYSTLKRANVLGTQEVLRLAVNGPTKPVHFISTLSVFAHPNADGMIAEDNPVDDWEGLCNGYTQSKWVAEKLVQTARARGLPVAIYRPATVGGDSVTGAGNVEDFVSRMIRGCIQLKRYPYLHLSLDILPVDLVSSMILGSSLLPDSLGKTFHITNPGRLPWYEVFTLIRGLGYELASLPYTNWREILNGPEFGEDNPLYPLRSVFSDDLDDESECQIIYDTKNMDRVMEARSFKYPRVEGSMLGKMIHYFQCTGCLETSS